MVIYQTANIHTIEVFVTRPEDIKKPISDKRISKNTLVGEGEKRRVVINANHGIQYSFHSNRSVFMGECETLHALDLVMRSIFNYAGIAYDHLVHQRADFKFYLSDAAFMRESVKYSNLLIAAYTAMWGCKPKNLYCGQAGQFGDYKNNKVRHGILEIEAYNKGIQKPSSRLQHRLEFRCIDLAGKPVIRSLRDWQKSLRRVKGYYTKATNLLNERLAKQYLAMRESTNGNLTLNDFIHCHMDGIFCREQLRDLYAMLGAKNPSGATKHYCDRFERNTRLFINKREFEAYIDALCMGISDYIA